MDIRLWNTMKGIMKKGVPGTSTSFALRIMQSLFSGIALVLLMVASRSRDLKVYRYLMMTTWIEVVWGLALACFDALLILEGTEPGPTIQILVGVSDLVAAKLMLSAVSFSSGPTIYFAVDTSRCSLYMSRDCTLVLASIGSAYVAWCLIQITLLLVLWCRLSGSGH